MLKDHYTLLYGTLNFEGQPHHLTFTVSKEFETRLGSIRYRSNGSINALKRIRNGKCLKIRLVKVPLNDSQATGYEDFIKFS